jgi:hypothetical protein
MFRVGTVSRLPFFFLLAMFISYAGAAQKATPSGKVTLETTSIAAGVGVSWGDGKLTFKGKTYPFSVDGLSLVDWGISKAQATGDVYNLTDPAKFGGTYVAAEAGLTLAGGVGGMVLRNQDGVLLHLRSVSQGARLQLGTSGLIIKMK